ncbi:CsbD family protein [Chachezhania antarctica]|uniref:CsbD family protein n=1 Tax=Chachezhania antarctica TaxID=2340860 RepID=UPI000EB06C31|nr:CsbD family protein [Chachezhania antarctica]|tara:strand:- start:1136 stop:1333 length:198 start_codon:yes stop_codon:yes gene_type:complete
MNWDIVQGNWTEYQGRVRSAFGKLTDDEVQQVKGDREQLEGLIQKKYGKTKEEAHQEVDKWLESA